MSVTKRFSDLVPPATGSGWLPRHRFIFCVALQRNQLHARSGVPLRKSSGTAQDRRMLKHDTCRNR